MTKQAQKLQIVDVHFGKVRDSAALSNDTRIIRTSDRISAFDMMMPFDVPRKGECLQNISLQAFEETADILPNHIIGKLDDRTILARHVHIIPIEFVMRRFVTGSLWRLVRKGGAQAVQQVYGCDLLNFVGPDLSLELRKLGSGGLGSEDAETTIAKLQNFRLSAPFFTPTHKAQEGHDEPLHLDFFDAILQNFLAKHQIANVTAATLKTLILEKLAALFLRGEEIAALRGLILVDTKYELGLSSAGELILADEVHTPDSSRYWTELPRDGALRQLSKEFLREELMGAEIIENDDLTAGGLEKLLAIAKDLSTRIADRYFELEKLFLAKSPASQSAHKTVPNIAWPIAEAEFLSATAPANKIQKLFIAGNGGRDFALMTRFSTLPGLRKVWNWPGQRAWKSRQVPVANLNAGSFESAVTHAAQTNFLEPGLDLVLAGPEIPIAQGIKSFCFERHIPCLAPGPKGAALEASKVVCKEALCAAGIATPEYETLPLSRLLEMRSAPRMPCVLKFDGLASGKGVFIIESQPDWEQALEEVNKQQKTWMQEVHKLKCESASAQAGEPVFLIEKLIRGEEYSIFALCNGTTFRLLPVARDYKRRNNGQLGPNTGGMGAVAPIQVNSELLAQFKDAFNRILEHQVQRGEPYQGFLFGGFMVTAQNKAYVLEFNSRLGDPETQVVLPGLGDDFLLECYRTAQGLEFFWPERSATFFKHDGLSRVFVVGAAPEYPESAPPYRKLRRRDREDTLPDSTAVSFVPSAIEADGRTKGGRAFGLLAKASSIAQARQLVYREMEAYLLEDMRPYYRTDIALEWER